MRDKEIGAKGAKRERKSNGEQELKTKGIKE